MAGWVENRALLSLLTVKLSVCPDSSAGPREIAVAQFNTVCAPASSFTIWFAPLENEGGSFTEVTVIVKLCDAEVSTPPFNVPLLSFRLTVMVAAPFAFAAGVYVSVLLELIAG